MEPGGFGVDPSGTSPALCIKEHWQRAVWRLQNHPEQAQLVPVALIVSELVANCIKHGFKDRSQGQITINFRRCLLVDIRFDRKAIRLMRMRNDKGRRLRKAESARKKISSGACWPLLSTIGQEPIPQRLEHEQSQSHHREIHDRSQYEHQVPA